MTKTYSLKSENKPTLFSYDLETEYKSVDCWVFDNRNYAKRDLEKEVAMLKLITKDYIEIINTNNILDTHLENLKTTITEGPSGVWETAANKLESLSYHFEEAKNLITELINNPKSVIIERALSAVSNAFETEELRIMINNLLHHRSKRIRIKASEVAFRINNQGLINSLQQVLEREHDNEVRLSIQFAIDNLNNPSN